jgi:hypothetical protein
MAPAVAPLLAVSGPATPSMAPWPKRSGLFEILRSTVYEMKVARTVAGPGISPVTKPTTEPRAIGQPNWRHSVGVGKRSRSRTLVMIALFIPASASTSTSATP